MNVLISPLVLGLSLSSVLAQSDNKSRSSDVSGSAISGRVVAQGKPLQGAVITLWQGYSEPTPNTTTATGRTGVDGNYELTDVPPGSYNIAATASGFVTGKENQFLGNLRAVVVVGSGVIDRINFELVPEGVIRGAVTDADGKPIARAPIKLFPESLLPADAELPLYQRGLRTDDQGTYRVAGLPAGRYRIAAGYRPVTTATLFGRVGYRRTFYPDEADQVNATVIEIAPRSEVTANINLGRPVKTFSVRARILDSQNGKPVADLDFAVDAFENGKRIGGANTRGRSNDNGEITIDNVPPGEYSIRVPGGSGIFPAGQVPPVPNIFGESKHFEVTDKDIGEIEIRVLRAATVSGFVVLEGAAGVDVLARVPQLRLVAMVEFAPIMHASIKPDGSFIFTGLKPGKLRFLFYPPMVGGPLPVRLVRTERDGVRLEQDPEILAGDQITDLRLVLAYANSSIRGIVTLDNSPLPPNITGKASVLQSGKVFQGAPVDARGNFLLQYLPAGEYTLAVSVRGADERYWRVEKKITIYDDRVSDARMELNSTAKATTPPTPRAVVPR